MAERFTGWAKPKRARLFHFFENGQVLCEGPWIFTADAITEQDDSRPCGTCRKLADEQTDAMIAAGGKKLIAAIFGETEPPVGRIHTMPTAEAVDRKRETDGKYAFDGNLDRVCVCGHTLGVHSAGSPADCLFYSLPDSMRAGEPGEDHKDCGCVKFRLSRRKR